MLKKCVIPRLSDTQKKTTAVPNTAFQLARVRVGLILTATFTEDGKI